MTGPEQVLVEDWCQQFPSHSVGSLEFGSDGALYASAGEGSNFFLSDYGQSGSPPNPCGDPPNGSGGTQTPPDAEGGALRAQDLRSTGDPTGLDGSVIRIDPQTGAARADNPLAGSSDPNARRIVAFGFRNPFRFTFRPGTNDLWVGDVGWNDWEELDHVANPTAAPLEFRVALLRGRRPSVGIRRGESGALREPLHGRHRGAAVLHLQPQREGRPGRDMRDG